MKKFVICTMVVCFGLVLGGCGGGAETVNPTVVNSEPVESVSVNSEEIKEENSDTEQESENEIDYEITYSHAKTYKNSIGTVWGQSIFEVTNTGAKPLYLSSGACDLEDESGTLITSRSMVSVYPDVIDPGEKAYYYEETTLDDLDELKELTIVPRPKVEAAKIDNIRFPVTDFILSDDEYNGIKMMGRIENTSDEDQEMIYVVAILFNENDEPIGQLFNIIMETLKPGDKIGFEGNGFSLPDDVITESVSRYEIFAYPQQYQF